MRIKKTVLKAAVLLFGRFARYRLTEKCFLSSEVPYAILADDFYRHSGLGVKMERGVARVDQLLDKEYVHRESGEMLPMDIAWRKSPNHAMMPLNTSAKIIHAAFLWMAGRETPQKGWDGDVRGGQPRAPLPPDFHVKMAAALYDLTGDELEARRRARRDGDLHQAKMRRIKGVA